MTDAESNLNNQWIYQTRPEGEVNEDHYQLVTSPVPTIEDGQILIKAQYISVDPYMRIQQAKSSTWEKPFPLGKVQGAGVIGQVIESQHDDYKAGDTVSTYTGWQQYACLDGDSANKITFDHTSYGLGVLGMPGRTAYFGLLEAGKPTKGDTLVVSGAAGAVGSIVCQIGRIYGCYVIGIAGSNAKCDYLKNELGCNQALNYKDYKNETAAIKAALAATAAENPERKDGGIDIYFDNVGGPITDAVLELINLRARIVICGQISQYNGALDEPTLGPRFLHRLIYTRATIQGILARDYTPRMEEMVSQMSQWLEEGQVKYSETIVQGFENLPKALNSLFHGKNTGKLVVQV